MLCSKSAQHYIYFVLIKPKKSLMRFKITLQALDRKVVLPINYQYPLSAWIYRTLEQGDRELADFLHQEGYAGEGRRRFKFYSFSELRTPGARVRGDRLFLTRPEVHFSISFLTDRAAQTLVMGLFRRSEPSWLGDDISGGRFSVRSAEMQMLPLLSEQVHFRTVSPAVIGIGDLNADGSLGKKYLSPQDEGYREQLVGNLRRKFTAAREAGLIETANPNPAIDYELLSRTVKEKRIDLLRGRPGYTRVRGYKFQFRLQAPEEVLRLALLAGIGEKNAMGFGGLEVVNHG